MHFNQIIKDKIYPLLQKLGFEVSDEYNSNGFGCWIRFALNSLVFSIAFDARERAFSAGISQAGESFPLTDEIIFKLYGIQSRLDYPSGAEAFAAELYTLLQHDKIQKMLRGDTASLKEFWHESSRRHEAEMLFAQRLHALDRAWEDKNDERFIALADELKPERLPASYGLKYKIAKKRRK